MSVPLQPTLRALIALLAEDLVDGYLRDQASNDAASSPERSEPVPLPDLDRAA